MGASGVREDHQEAGTPPAAMAVPPVLVKGKRSKRQRVHAPPVVLSASATASAAPEWSSSAASAATATAEEESGTSRSDEAASSGGGGGCLTEEDEDMALCLMLLARGVPAVGAKEDEVAVVVAKEARFRSRRPAAGAAAGEYVYECKTCNKCFPSFQALGGHRTSHKKPRLLPPPPALASEDISSKAAAAAEPAAPSPSLPPTPPPPVESTADATVLAIPVPVPVAPKPEQQDAAAAAIIVVATSSVHSKHPRVHECSICGAEFGSGQALGGHMRRHRPLVPAAARDDAPRKEKSLLELDLNMPAPCDEVAAEAPAVTSPRFEFAVAERPAAAAAPLLFPASATSALVDCHY